MAGDGFCCTDILVALGDGYGRFTTLLVMKFSFLRFQHISTITRIQTDVWCDNQQIAEITHEVKSANVCHFVGDWVSPGGNFKPCHNDEYT